MHDFCGSHVFLTKSYLPFIITMKKNRLFMPFNNLGNHVVLIFSLALVYYLMANKLTCLFLKSRQSLKIRFIITVDAIV